MLIMLAQMSIPERTRVYDGSVSAGKRSIAQLPFQDCLGHVPLTQLSMKTPIYLTYKYKKHMLSLEESFNG